MLNEIISGVAGGGIILFIQTWIEKRKKEKEDQLKKIVGNPNLKIIDKEFLYNYVPGKVSIEKIFEDFGQPDKKSSGSGMLDSDTIIYYKYIFKNAKVEFTVYENQSDILSITLFATYDRNNPVYCRLSYAENNQYMGKATISDIIIENEFSFEKVSSIRESSAIIKARHYDYPTIKHLYFCYEVIGDYNSIGETKGQIIHQVCVSQLDSICPMFTFWDTFYN
nr:hypothetical protein [uncultured Flavobacterium sp.]